MKKITVTDYYKDLERQIKCHEQKIKEYKITINIAYWIGVASGILIHLALVSLVILIMALI